MNTFYDLTMKSLTGDNIHFSHYAGKVVLIVNVASKCEYTPQYHALQALYEKYHDKGLDILGVPCNQFWEQEPGSPMEIIRFCESNYSVSFPLTEKTEVKGEGICPLYQFLTESNEDFAGDISWNFEKFIIDRQGNIANRFSPETKPDAAELVQQIKYCIHQKDSIMA